VPDISGDGLADVVIVAPHEPVDQHSFGMLVARSPKTGAEIWKRVAADRDNFGWDITSAGDQNGDGYPDIFVGSPSENDGHLDLLNGRGGTGLRTYTRQIGPV